MFWKADNRSIPLFHLPRIVVGVAAVAAVACSPDRTKAVEQEWEQKYIERLEARRDPAPLGLSSYAPLDTIRGDRPYEALKSWSSDDHPIAASALAEMRRWAERSNASSLLVAVDGRLLVEEYFGENDASTPVVSLSLAKPLSVVAVGRAIEQGYIRSLDQSAADFLHEWRGTQKASITIRHLLQMRSGLLGQDFSNSRPDIMNRAYLHPNHAQVIIDEYPLVKVPGSHYAYANANGELIAPIIKRATGSSYADWLSDEVIKPLGAQGGQVWVNRAGGTAHSGCCALLPPETWLRLSLLLMNEGRWNQEQLLPPGFVDEMRKPQTDFPQAGMGVYLSTPYTQFRSALSPERQLRRGFHSEPYLADDLFLFDGNASQVSYMIPSLNMVILRTGNWPSADFEWDNTFLPNTAIRGWR